MAKKTAPKYRILSFDGGGLRGLLSLELLRRVCEKTEKAKDWYVQSDLFAGTSTGGLIALGLADGKNIEEIKEFYTGAGPKIFNRKTFYYFTSLLRFTHIGYRRDLLEKTLIAMFGDKKIDALKKRVMVVSFDLNKEASPGRFVWQPKVIHNFPFRLDDVSIVDAGLSTSAAPTYLPSRESLIDGGVCANNPAMCALTQVLDDRGENKVRNVEDIVMVSIGTGNNPAPIGVRNLDWGILKWNTRLLKLLNDGGIKMVDYQCGRILKDRYLRIDVELKEKIELDDVTKLDEIMRIAAAVPEEQIREWAAWIDKNW